MKNIVVIYSGGMDSFTLLHEAIHTAGHDNVHAVTFDYGQRHKREIDAARGVTKALGISHDVIDLSDVGKALSSSLTDMNQPVPLGHYEEPSMKQTVVPSRNLILLSIASGIAVSLGAEQVWFGAHAGDHAIYPDCRKAFVIRLNEALLAANYSAVNVCAPYIEMDKGGILARGLALGLCVNDYANTWTCYNGGDKSCGACGACVERAEAFKSAGLVDPLCL